MVKADEKLAMQVSVNTVVANVVLSAFKLVAGIIGNSTAMISDAVHSMSDVLSTFIVMIGVKMANAQSDKEHPYGHERMECVAAIILAVVLAGTGIMIGWTGIQKIIANNYGNASIPGVVALIAAIASIVIKEGMYWYTRAAAKKIDSSALMADAWHHRSDAFSSIGSFIGIFGARIGFPILDPLACIVICFFIMKAAFDIFRDAVNKMTDKACDDTVVDAIRTAVLTDDAVMGVDQIKTRLFGNRIYADVEITAHHNATLVEAHSTAHRVHDLIEARFPKIKHCTVHVNPAETTE